LLRQESLQGPCYACIQKGIRMFRKESSSYMIKRRSLTIRILASVIIIAMCMGTVPGALAAEDPKENAAETAVYDRSADGPDSKEEDADQPFSERHEEILVSEEMLEGIDFSSARLLVAGEIIDPENELSSYEGIHLMQYGSPEAARNAYAYYYGRTAFVEADTVVWVADGNGGAVGPSEMTEGETPLDELASAPEISGYDIALIDTGVNTGAAASVSIIGDDVSDENGHGTAMAEIILSENPDASILSVKALGADGSGDVSAVYAAVKYAIEARVSIISLSVCAPKKADSAAIVSAVNEALANGITVVAAAGNYGSDASYYIPGGIEEALTIGACSENGEVLASSNHGDCIDFYAAGGSTSQAAARFTGIFSRNGSAEADFEKIFPADRIPQEEPSEEPQERWTALGIEEVDAMAGQGSESSLFRVQSTAEIVEQEVYEFYGAAAPHLTDTSGNLIYCILPWSIAPDGVTAQFNDYTIGPESSENLMLMAKIMYYGYGGDGNILTGSGHEQEAATHFALSYVWLSLMGNTHGGPDWTVTGASSLNEEGQTLVMNFVNRVKEMPDVTGSLHIASLYEASGETWQDLAYGHFSAAGGKVRVKKRSEDPDVTDGNSCYSVRGAAFGLYSSETQAGIAASSGEMTGSEIAVLKTDDSGVTPYSSKLEAGTYYLAEIAAPRGYKRNTSVKTVSLAAGDEKEVSFADGPVFDTAGLTIEKLPKGTAAAADEDLSGAEYEIRFYAGDSSGTPYTRDTLPSEASAVWVIRTSKTPEGSYAAELDDDHMVSGAAKYGKSSSGAFYIPLGTITLEEIKAPAGFMIKGSTMELEDGNGADAAEGVILMNLTDDGTGISVKSGNQVSEASDGFGIISREAQIRGGVKLAKLNAETDKPDERCEGTEIGIFADGTVYDHNEGKTYYDGELAAAVKIDRNGIAETGKDALPAGSYIARETAAAGPFVENTEWSVSFSIAEDGVTVDLTSKPLKNSAARGGVQIVKKDGQTKTAQGDADLSGIRFAVISRNDSEVVNKEGEKIGAGRVVQVITTDSDGIARTGAKDLMYGTYDITEMRLDDSVDSEHRLVEGSSVMANASYRYSGQSRTVEVQKSGVREKVKEAYVNEVIRGGVRFKKIDRETRSGKAQGRGTLAGAEITVYNNSAEAVMYDGKLYGPGDAVTVLTTDEKGGCGTGADALPYGTYFAKETGASDGYSLNEDWRVDFRIREEGVIVDTADEAMHITDETGASGNDRPERSGWFGVNGGLEDAAGRLPEQVSRADLSFYKVDIDGRKFANIPFMISRLDEEGRAVESHVAVTGADGCLNTKDLSKTDSRVNSLDKYVKNGVFTDDTKLDPDAGIWFGGQPAGDDSEGALVCANYLIREIRCEANAGQDLLEQYLFEKDITPENIFKAFSNNAVFSLDNVFVDLGLHPESDLLDAASGSKVVSLGESVQVVDTIRYDNLKTYQTYKVDTEIFYTDREGNVSCLGHSEIMFSPEKTDNTDTADGSVRNTVVINTKSLDGGTVSAKDTFYIAAEEGDIKLISHNDDLTDERQMLYVPWMSTAAADSATGDHVGAAVENASITDTVTYENLADDRMYLLEGTLRFADTGEPVTGSDGSPCVTSKTLRISWRADKPSERSYGTLGPKDGTVTMPAFVFDASALGGRKVVVTEVLYDYDIYRDGSDNSEAVIIEHCSLEDEDQSLYFPKITTEARDTRTGSRAAVVSEKEKIIDTVTITNAVPGLEYTVNGTLVYREDCVDAAGAEHRRGEVIAKHEPVRITAEKETVIVRIGFEIDSTLLEGLSGVVFEDVWHNDVKVAVHHDYDSEKQTPAWPKVRTSAKDDSTGSRTGNAMKETASITDTVSLTNLIVGDTYMLEGTLMYSDGTPFTIDGEAAAVRTDLFTAEEKDMSMDMTFSFPASGLQGKSLVVFEKLYHRRYEGNTDDPRSAVVLNMVEAARHEDLQDEGQTIRYPEGRTNASDSRTGDETGTVGETETIIDTVSCKNLVVGEKYIITGSLHYREDCTDAAGREHAAGETVRDAAGRKIISTAEFTAETTGCEIQLKYELDSSLLRGLSVVVFEEFCTNGIKVYSHADLNDQDQTVYYPEIRTSLKDAKTHIDHTKADEEAEVIDTVSYRNLRPGKEYVMKGMLVYRESGEPVVFEGEQVTAEEKFVPEKPDGTVKVRFVFNASVLQGETVVAFEYCCSNDIAVAFHTDIEDADQTVYIPEISTTALAHDTQDHITQPSEKVTIIDTVSYRGLKAGTRYSIKGILMDRESGKPLISDGREAAGSTTFVTGGSGSGTVEVRFDFDASDLAGRSVVVFEQLYRRDKLTAVHEDLTDEGQTVSFPEKPETPERPPAVWTGDFNRQALWIILFAAGITGCAAAAVMVRKRVK